MSQVLFADSTKASGNDIIYYLNRIGIECTGSCPGLTVGLQATQKVIVPNMPQFLQRQIKKNANGFVNLLDTANLMIQPDCQPNQTWVFDAVNSKSATCLSISATVNFGVPDSIKLILIGGIDTLLLSKNFGILQFPVLYNKNKYYRLAGVEKSNSYDANALYGEKVPNAWDFYNFNVGDQFCYEENLEYTVLSHQKSNMMSDLSVLSKSVSGTGYTYGINGHWSYYVKHYSYPPTITSGSNSVLTYSNLSSATLFENKAYPGLIYQGGRSPSIQDKFINIVILSAYNIIKFGQDNKGNFMKYAGMGSSRYTNTSYPYVPATTFPGLFYYQGYLEGGNYISNIYVVGLRNVAGVYWAQGTGETYVNCQTCAVKNGTLYHGNLNLVNINETVSNESKITLFPNPTENKIFISIGSLNVDQIRITTILGETLFQIPQNLQNQNLEIDLSKQTTGIYFVQFFNKNILIQSQKVIKK